MPGYIGRERLLQVQALCQLLQLLVVAIQCRLILGKGLVRFRCPQNREKVRRISRRRMPDDNFAHARFDADAQRLPGFATRVDDFIVPDIFRLQIGHVDESHAARAVTENKEVACQRERGGIGQIQSP